MSETTATPAPAEEYVPRDVLTQEDNEDATKPLQQQGEAPATNGEAEAEEEKRRTERRREAQRIGYLTKQRYAEKARADAMEARLRELEQRQNGGAQPEFTPQQFEQLVEQRAAQKVAAEQANARFSEWDQHGIEQFGQDKFREACKTVAELASDQQRQVLVDVAMDTEGGARAIMEMADNAEEAERILALPPHRMALAIAKLGAEKAPAPKQVSNAPPPIRPPAVGRARGEPDPERGSMSDFEKWSAKQQWRR